MSECHCGKPHPRCDKHNRAGGPCGHMPVTGTTTCPLHAGKALSVIRQEVATTRALADLDLDMESANPLDELLTEVARASAAVRWLSDKVNTLDDDEVVAGITQKEQDTSDASYIVTTKERIHPWIVLWQNERDRLARVCKMTLDAGVDERRVRLAESQGRMIVDVIRATLVDLGVTEDDQVTTVVTKHLRALTA